MTKSKAEIEKNLRLWSEVEESDPKSVKEISYGNRKFHAIDAHSQIKQATKVFGVYGIDWGVQDESFNVLGNTLLLYQGFLRFTLEGKEGIFPIASSIKIVSSKGAVDDECVKKAATDALTKGLSKLGFNSDVFENKFSDNRYVEKRERDTSLIREKEAEERLIKDRDRLIKIANEYAEKGKVDKVAKIWKDNP